MGSKTDTFGNPPEPALEIPPEPQPSGPYWKSERGPDGVERLVPSSLRELKSDIVRFGVTISPPTSYRIDWDPFKS